MSASNANDLSGLKFGRLTALRQVGHRKFPAGGSHAVWECACECGSISIFIGGSLLSGHTKSCGCLKTDEPSALRHGHNRGGRKTRTYQTWINMRGRGIPFDPKWASFDAFLADMGERPQGMTLDRIENNLGYYKANCRWADKLTQIRNKTNRIVVEYRGEAKPLIEWCRELGFSYWGIHRRYSKGIRGDALFAPLVKSRGGRLVLKPGSWSV